ncbi:hypothetical protein BGX23_007993 [Mortierella sp. AD031]|nr:hypothetical protein BGX23_007993 [Mortierella sp. AD031]
MVFYNDTLSSRPEFIKHLNYCNVHDRLAADQPVGLFFDETPRDVDHAACRELQRDISWALCADTERVQSLVIPISDISRYLALIPRLKVLSSITFYLDENFEHYLDLEGDDELTSQEQETLVRRQEDRTQHLEDIVRFVQEHRQFHPHILAVATCPGCQEEEYQFRLLECLPPLRSPLSLNSISWIHFVAKLQDTDLSFVQSISPPAISISDRFCKQSPFLNRCRSLDIINITSWGDDLFQWAIDERKAFNAEVAVGRTPDRPLVPLRDVSINYRNLSYGNQVDDITFGFGKTLESLVIVGHFPRIMNAHLHQEDFTFGNRHSPRSWNLPNLYRLSVDIHYIFLRIDPYFLALSPNLVTCTSKDKRTTYSIDEVECWFPADLPRLTHLILVGTPAISLDPDTLRTTPNLNHLELLLESTIGNIFIPPSEALDYIGSIGTASSTTTESPPSASSSSSSTLPLPRRPVWTWDWELPKLSTITLNSVFAYQFQFRMLQKTPSLASLSLDIKSTTNEHQRYIISEDFFSHTPPKSYWDYHDDWKDLDFEDNNDYIHLETLFLNGYWTTSDLVLSVLFRKVAPNIAGLSMVGDCCGFSLWGWVEMTSRHLPWLSEANSSYGWIRSLLKRLAWWRRRVPGARSVSTWRNDLRDGC